jgi:hypothetical protein
MIAPLFDAAASDSSGHSLVDPADSPEKCEQVNNYRM